MGSFTDETCCSLLLQAQRFCDLSPGDGVVAIALCWGQRQSCAHAMKAVRLASAGTGVVSAADEALCPAVSVHPVSQTIFDILLFFNGASAAITSSQPPAIFGWKSLLLLQAKPSPTLVFTLIGGLMTHAPNEHMPESPAGPPLGSGH